MPSKNKPGCTCCKTPENCCDGTLPSTIIVTVAAVAGGIPADNPWCALELVRGTCDFTFNDTFNLINGAGGCVWGFTRNVKDICGTGAAGCDDQYTTINLVLRIIEESGTWYIRIWIYITSVYPVDWGIPNYSYFTLWESNEGATQPLCNQLSFPRTFTLISDDTCCDWTGATVDI